MHKDPAVRRRYMAGWYRRNRVTRLAYLKAWRAAHPEARRASVRRYAEADPERRRAQQAAFARKHPDRMVDKAMRRRSALAGASGSHTAREWREKLELFSGCCAYCGRGDVRLERDHKIPLTRDGSNDIENIVPACRTCNALKGRRTATEFLAQRTAA